MSIGAFTDGCPDRTATPMVRPDHRQAHGVFRAVLTALSRPGGVGALPEVAGVPAALLPLLALADLDTPICVLGHPDGPIAVESIAAATSAPVAASAEARLVAALRPVTVTELAELSTGSAAAPEGAALVTLAVPALTGGPVLRLSGPGVPPTGRRIAPAGLPTGWLQVRAATSFPAGIDLVLVEPGGRLVGIPRSTRMGSTRVEG